MPQTMIQPGVSWADRLRGHVAVCRVDHWFKNVFVLPGLVVALWFEPSLLSAALPWSVLVGGLAVCLVASSNYVLNEVLDAPFDRLHPIKRTRPVPSGFVHTGWAYAQWLSLMAAGIALAAFVSEGLAWTLVALWVMGIVYNVGPIRTKDVAYLDVTSEAVNNPLRMIAGWCIAGAAFLPPLSLLLAYWMVGSYFMALKRFAEYRQIGDKKVAAAYRTSFKTYTEETLLISTMFYGTCAMLFFGAFLMRYRLELVLAFPAIAFVMAVYLRIALKPESPAQAPERLYRERLLMLAVGGCLVLLTALLFIDIPWLHQFFHAQPNT